jgi:hypothetical protein
MAMASAVSAAIAPMMVAVAVMGLLVAGTRVSAVMTAAITMSMT